MNLEMSLDGRVIEFVAPDHEAEENATWVHEFTELAVYEVLGRMGVEGYVHVKIGKLLLRVPVHHAIASLVAGGGIFEGEATIPPDEFWRMVKEASEICRRMQEWEDDKKGDTEVFIFEMKHSDQGVSLHSVRFRRMRRDRALRLVDRVNPQHWGIIGNHLFMIVLEK